MGFKFSERPYSGKMFRPRPEIHLDPQTHLLIVATPWGVRSAARKVIDRMTDYLTLARDDREATSPFERLSCLSTQANNLRIAALLANEALYREENKQEYKAGVELFAGILEDNEFVWLQAGNPQVLLGRAERKFLPLGSQIDLAFDLSPTGDLLPPLPTQLLGLDTSINMSINSFRAHSGDQLILLSHSHLPDTLFSMKGSEASLESISHTLAQSHPDLAYWLGILSINAIETESIA